MVPPHRLKRHILVIDSNLVPPIKLLDANFIHNNDVYDLNPFILAHIQNHYQSMVPLPGSEEFWKKIVDEEVKKNKNSAISSVINNNVSDIGSKTNNDAGKSTVKDTINVDINHNNQKEIEDYREVKKFGRFASCR
jgi:hypothetical protein